MQTGQPDPLERLARKGAQVFREASGIAQRAAFEHRHHFVAPFDLGFQARNLRGDPRILLATADLAREPLHFRLRCRHPGRQLALLLRQLAIAHAGIAGERNRNQRNRQPPHQCRLQRQGTTLIQKGRVEEVDLLRHRQSFRLGVGGDFNCIAVRVQREAGAGQERSIGARCIALRAQGQTFLGDAFFRERLQGGRCFERLNLVRVDADAPQVYRVGERGN